MDRSSGATLPIVRVYKLLCEEQSYKNYLSKILSRVTIPTQKKKEEEDTKPWTVD